MLLTDSDVVTHDSMAEIDPDIDSVVRAEKSKPGSTPIVIEGTRSICERAWGECRSRLEAALTNRTTMYGTLGMANHMAFLTSYGQFGGDGSRSIVRLNQIVTHDVYYPNGHHPVETWMIYGGLRMLYQTASNKYLGDKLGDRYKLKYDMYVVEQDRVWQEISAQGMPVVNVFFDRPGAKHGWQAGIWDAAAITLTPDPNNLNASPNDPKQQIDIAITYVDAADYVSPVQKGNAESAPSDRIEVTLPPGQLANVSIANLNPPSGIKPNVGFAQAIAPSHIATGWIVYAGAHGAPLWQQSTVIPISTQTFTLPAALATNTYLMDRGQWPVKNVIFGKTLTRG